MLWDTAHVAPAFDLTIDEIHAYHVTAGGESVLVHNNDGCDIEETRSTAELRDRAVELLGPEEYLVVLGRLSDTRQFKGQDGFSVLADEADWSPELNEAFIEQVIEEGRSVNLASPIEGNRIADNGAPTIFSMEFDQLLAAGYHPAGDSLLPPN